MIGLLRRAPAKRAGRPSRVFLRLEAFEGRATPSGSLTPQTSTAGQTGTTTAAPQIVNFTATQTSPGVFVITGQVIDANPAGLTVTFGGAVSSLKGTTVTTDANGNFTLTVTLKTDGSDTGWLTAQTTDRDGLVSDLAYTYVQPTAA